MNFSTPRLKPHVPDRPRPQEGAQGAGGDGDGTDGGMVETQMSVPGVSDLAGGIV